MSKIQEVKDQAMGSLTEAIEQEKKEQWRVEGRNMLFDAKRVRKSKTCFFMLWPPGGGNDMMFLFLFMSIYPVLSVSLFKKYKLEP